ncbi:hypothetical protein V8E36_002871 [Tilletia maclaganii]
MTSPAQLPLAIAAPPTIASPSITTTAPMSAEPQDGLAAASGAAPSAAPHTIKAWMPQQLQDAERDLRSSYSRFIRLLEAHGCKTEAVAIAIRLSAGGDLLDPEDIVNPNFVADDEKKASAGASAPPETLATASAAELAVPTIGPAPSTSLDGVHDAPTAPPRLEPATHTSHASSSGPSHTEGAVQSAERRDGNGHCSSCGGDQKQGAKKRVLHTLTCGRCGSDDIRSHPRSLRPRHALQRPKAFGSAAASASADVGSTGMSVEVDEESDHGAQAPAAASRAEQSNGEGIGDKPMHHLDEEEAEVSRMLDGSIGEALDVNSGSRTPTGPQPGSYSGEPTKRPETSALDQHHDSPSSSTSSAPGQMTTRRHKELFCPKCNVTKTALKRWKDYDLSCTRCGSTLQEQQQTPKQGSASLSPAKSKRVLGSASASTPATPASSTAVASPADDGPLPPPGNGSSGHSGQTILDILVPPRPPSFGA